MIENVNLLQNGRHTQTKQTETAAKALKFSTR